MLGRPRCVGISLKQIARAPRAALRATSATARSTSQSGMMHSGIRCAAGVGAPVLDHPVVVRPHAFEPELEVVALHERLAAKARERRERERAVDPGEREVVDARLRLVTARPHLVVRHRRDVHLAAVEPAHVAVGRRVERDRDVALVHVDQAGPRTTSSRPTGRPRSSPACRSRRRRGRSRPTARVRRAAPARACAPAGVPARDARARPRGRRR